MIRKAIDMKFAKKGCFGYIDGQKRWTLLRTIAYFILCAAVFTIGYMTTGSRRNLMTIVAVLGCLPACKSAVNYIMFLKAKGCSKGAYDSIEPAAKGLYAIYDLYMTSYKANFPISHLVIAGGSIVAYAEEKIDVNEAETHIKDHLKQDGYKNITVKVFTDLDKYIERLEQIQELSFEPMKSQDAILEMLLAISL